MGISMRSLPEFVYLGALMDKEGGTTKDIQHRLSKARQTFYSMRKIWSTSEIGRKMKVQLFKTIVRSVLMYGCETWKLETWRLENRSKEAGCFPIQVHEAHTKNKVAPNHLPPTNPGNHKNGKNK